MSTGPLHDLIPQLRQALLRADEPGAKDGDLLQAFVSSRDEAALETLVQRHAPMVWGVCRRVLRGHQDAEDAFQATFLVLVRKAASVRPREMVGNWLYGVAHRTALKARATAARRKAREEAMAEPSEVGPAEEDHWADLRPILDRELSRLPSKYRAVLVLCDLEGKTRKETAGQTGLPEGTVASRLARARGMLASRLARHGSVLSAGALASVFSQGVAPACPPTAVAPSVVKAACLLAVGKAAVSSIPAQVADLAEGVVRVMLLNKLLKATAVLLLVGVATGTGLVLTHSAEGRKQEGKPVRLARAPAPRPGGSKAGLPNDASANKESARKELDKLNGLWACVGYEKDGVEHLGKAARRTQYHEELWFKTENASGGRLSLQWALDGVGSTGAAVYGLHPTTEPKGIDVKWQGGGSEAWGKGALPKDRDKVQPCAYSVEGDNLRLCWGEVGSKVRPAAVKTKRGDGRTVVLYKRNTTGFLIGERPVGRAGAEGGSGAEKTPRDKIQEGLVGKWEDPSRPGNSLEFGKDGTFTAEISGGVIRARTGGTYRVLKDGSLEWQVKVGNEVAPPRRFMVKVTKKKLTLIDKQLKESIYQRAR